MRGKHWLIAVIVWAMVAGCRGERPIEEVARLGAARESGTFSRYAVASDHRIASLAGAAMLERGGNAIDAAVATSFALSVVRPYSCGIGGGGFMVIRFADGRAMAFDYREIAPAAVGRDYYVNKPDDASTRGGTAVGVPGTVAGLLEIHERFGRLDRATILAPAIEAAERGFVVDGHYISSTRSLVSWYREDASRQARFAFVWERLLRRGSVREGDLIRLPEQADALRLIARDGARAFYEGEIAHEMLRVIQEDGGSMTADDLRQQGAVERAPVQFNAFGRSFVSMPPPSSGGLAIGQMLKIYEQTDRSPHALVESMKHAFADRARYAADPASAEVPVARLLSDAYITARAAQVGPTTRPIDTYGDVAPQNDDAGTSHLCVIDADGTAVACTETINLIFGSQLAVAKYGFVLNNEMDDFTTRPGEANAFGLVQSDANAPGPGRKPLSSMTPTIMIGADGQVEAIAGAAGGPRIITATAQLLLNVIEGKSASEAMDAPRLHHQWMPDVTHVEKGMPADTIERLERAGQTVRASDGAIGNANLIRRSLSGSGWDASADPRKGGRVAGE
jgi:gamma-glutamyltranspeptidase/glutathione hydrolase